MKKNFAPLREIILYGAGAMPTSSVSRAVPLFSTPWMTPAGGPDDVAAADHFLLVTQPKMAFPFHHVIKLVLVGVVVGLLHLPWLQAVKAQKQGVAAKQGFFEEFFRASANVIL